MTTMIERIEAAIEEAARKSVPWPSVLISPSGWDIDDDEVPQTLEHFVTGTYIGADGADEVFRAAAKAATRAALTAMLECGDQRGICAESASYIQAALDEKDG
jgi:hypothetical protein